MKQRSSLIIACASLVVMLTILLSGPAVSAQQIIVAPYFPLSPGSWWKFTPNGTEIFVKRVLSEEVAVNSILTRVIEDRGQTEYFTNDSLGIRQHRLVEYPPGITLTLIPPAVLSPPVATLGQTTTTNGTVHLTIPEEGLFDIAYSASVLLVGIESVSTPYGTFESVKIQTIFRMLGNVGGELIDDQSISYSWLVKDIGVVKLVEYIDGKEYEEILIDTNLPQANSIVP
ncbi:MAG: hypothetical protein KJ804_15985, partial [Proteobacteria bacterium]|nr:hypothetical protein [Pseudomonadota bacterium]MBU1059811.1 hypothetical protein [Pseudomonadota bacterium]